MKNLMVFISPTGSFNNPRPDLKSNDAGPLAKVQIENSLELGWEPEDILLYTNFDFQYGPISAKVIPDIEFAEFKPQVSKINAIVKLFKKDLIDDDLYWFHDLDAFQLYPFKISEIALQKKVMGLTTYISWVKWNTASIFFKKSSKDIFYTLQRLVYKDKSNEEIALKYLINKCPEISTRVKNLNSTYCFQISYDLKNNYEKATKPIKVAHFHPLIGYPKLQIDNNLDYFKGENELRTPLITDRLIRIFKFHRIR